MGAGQSLKDAYYSLEDKWYGFVDAVSAKVPAFGGFIDAMEDRGVPTFPALIAVIIIVIALLAYFFLIAANSSLTINVTDSAGNAIEGATVTVLAGTNEAGSLLTDASGNAVFLLPNGEYSIKVDKDTYSTSVKTIALAGNDSEDLTLTQGAGALTKAVYLKTSTGAAVEGSGSVIYRCAGTTTEQTATYSNGKFDAQVGASCANVEVLSIQNYDLVTSTASFAADSSVTVQRQVVLTGSASVTLTTSDNNSAPPAGLRVRLVPNDGTVPIEEITTGTSVVAFDSVPIKTYYVIVADPNGAFETYDGSKTNNIKDVTHNETTQFSVSLARAQSTTIAVTVKDAGTGMPVKGAVITLTSAANQNDTQEQTTDVTGQKSFMVAAGTSYTVTAEQDNYITGTTKQANAGDTVELDLVKATEANSNSILVQVMDPKGAPIENARVILKKTDAAGTSVGEKTTGASGSAEFFNLDITQTYFAAVSKEGFGSQNSASISAQPRSQRTIQVTFDIGEGHILLKVLDPQKNPLSGASVKAINYYTSQQEGTTILSDTQGVADFTLRADKKVYFVVETTAYEKYFTSSVQASANASISKEVVLQTRTGKLAATLVGIFGGTQEIPAASASAATVGQGVYTVRAVVTVPKGSYSEAGLQLRTGKETPNITNLMEEDGLHLSDIESSGRITRGTTYTPPQGQETDNKNLSTGDAKWANSVWRNPSEGTYEMEAQVTVTEDNPNVPLNLYYRGWAKGSTTLRDPQGDVLGQELYWPAKNRVLTSGASNLCSQTFCKSYILQTLTGTQAGRTTFVSGTMEAKKGVTYSLEADLTNYSGRAMSGAVLKITGKSVDINSIMVNGAQVTGTSGINLGTIGVDAPIKVVVVFTTNSAGNSAVGFTINSATGTELDESVTLHVPQNRSMDFAMLPRVVVPYIDNSLYFTANDGNTLLDGVNISIKSGGDLLATVQTNGEGIARYVIAQPRIGDELTITAQKEGYDDSVITQKVDKALLTITPPSITQTIKVGDVTGIDTELILENNTVKDLKINSVAINGDIKSYFDMTFSDIIAGTVVAQGTDRNYMMTLKLNSAAMRITDAKDLHGTVLINTQVAGTNQNFVNEIPIDIHLSLPGYLDNAKCLQVTPASIEFTASDSEQSKTVTLTNNCEAEGYKIALHDIEAKLSDAVKIGTVTLSGEGLGNVQLSDKYSKITDTLDNGADTELTVRFSPNVAIPSGTQAFTISLTGNNLLNAGIKEKVEGVIKLNATTSLLSKCVEIQQPSGGLMIDLAPWNLGYNQLLSSSYSPYLGNYQGIVNRNSPFNMPYTPGLGMMGYGMQGYGAGYGIGGFGAGAGIGGYGLGGYGMGGYGVGGIGSAGLIAGQGGIGSATNMSFQQNSFIIKNNCTNDVDIQLEPDSRVTVDQQAFTISADSDKTVVVQPGYVLGKYNITVNAKISGSTSTKKKLSDVSVVIRRLGDIDTDCIKTNVTNINLNSFIYKPQQYSVYNSCYDTGVQLSRTNSLATIDCSAPQNQYDLGFFQVGQQGLYGQQFPLTAQNPTYQSYLQNTRVQNTGLSATGCPISSCSLITGTRTRYRTIEQGATGSVERVDFDVMPSAQYIPQMKLFNGQNNSYGLFQNLSNIRAWGTETAARTDVYGNLNVSYSNQYGSGECMQFPITITDTWRILESIDSAINWGDPNASPKECQNDNALNITSYWKSTNPQYNGAVPDGEYKANNGTTYIRIAEPPAMKIGAAPSTQSPYAPGYNTNYFWNQANMQQTGGVSSNAQQISSLQGQISSLQMQISSMQASGMPMNSPQVTSLQTQITGLQGQIASLQSSGQHTGGAGASSTSSKNCGLLDSIDVTTQITPQEAGGAVVTISDTGSGSILNNTRGSNLMVQVDRSNMTVNCVHLKKPITAKVTRAINFQSQTLTWGLDIIITKKGYVYDGDDSKCMQTGATIVTDCKEAMRKILTDQKITSKTDTARIQAALQQLYNAKPACNGYFSMNDALALIDEMNAGSTIAPNQGCAFSSAEYGFDKIDKTGLADNFNKDTLTDCSKYFCNGDMLQAYLLTKFADIKALTNALGNPQGLMGGDLMLSKLYKQAGLHDVNICSQGALKFYAKEDKTLGYTVPFNITTDMRTVSGTDQNATILGMGANSLNSMVSVIDNMKAKMGADYNTILLETDANATYDSELKLLNTARVGNKWYMSIATYREILQAFALDDAKNYRVSGTNIVPGGDNEGIDFEGDVCGIKGVIMPNTIRWMSYNSKLVQGISGRANLSDQNIEQIYAANSKLNAIHQLAKFDTSLGQFNSGISKSILAAAVADTAKGLNNTLFHNQPANITGLKLAFIKIGGAPVNSLEIARYPMELDFNYANPSATDANIIVGNKNTVEGSPSASQNPLLETGFAKPSEPASVLANSTSGTLVELTGGKLTLYKRAPIQLKVQLFPNEPSFSYKLMGSAAWPQNLMNWYTDSGTKIGTDTLTTTGYTINVTPQQSAQTTIRGAFYYPGADNSLVLSPGINGGEVFAKVVTLTQNQGWTSSIPTKASPSSGFNVPAEVAPQNMTLDNVVNEVASGNGNACPIANGVIWNEKKIIGAN